MKKWVVIILILGTIGIMGLQGRLKILGDRLISPVGQKKALEEIKLVDQSIKNLVLPKKDTGVGETKIIYVTPTMYDDGKPWGVSEQIGEVSWRIKVGMDAEMATAGEIFNALNEYRRIKGSSVLNWDDKLANYALERAEYFISSGELDEHKGFVKFLEEEDGFNKLGFTWLGENASIGYRLNGVHLIEWVYAGDEPHDKNQLDNKWAYVGVGVKGTANCLIFGTGKF